MLGLIKTQFASAWNSYCRRQAEPGVSDRPRQLDSFVLQFCHGGLNVFAHEIELMVAVAVRGMDTQFGRRKRKD